MFWKESYSLGTGTRRCVCNAVAGETLRNRFRSRNVPRVLSRMEGKVKKQVTRYVQVSGGYSLQQRANAAATHRESYLMKYRATLGSMFFFLSLSLSLR